MNSSSANPLKRSYNPNYSDIKDADETKSQKSDDPRSSKVQKVAISSLPVPSFSNLNGNPTPIISPAKQTTEDKFLSELDEQFKAMHRKTFIDSSSFYKLSEYSVACQNSNYNRYTNVLPKNGNIAYAIVDQENIYVNASKINLGSYHYIAAQGPTKKTLASFLMMTYTQDALGICITTKAVEGFNSKCYGYWEFKEEQCLDCEKVGVINYTISKSASVDENLEGLEILDLVITPKGLEPKKFPIYRVLNWSDHGAITVDLCKSLVSKLPTDLTKKPLIVHCSAGLGRTGVVILAHSMVYEPSYAIKFTENLNQTAEEILSLMRDQRANMVQTKEQYRLAVSTAKQLLDNKF
ncbi:MAG: hypothetical protein K0S74_1038 [Chlamydiales bacterium]|jgi:protein tyrosine phosphatase|nr:hypothetical protein [Chlamydiales bacterium]